LHNSEARKQAKNAVRSMALCLIFSHDPSSEEFTTLKMISGETGGTGPREIQNFNEITDVIFNIGNEILAKPIAANVITTDTLYPYLKVLGTDPDGSIVNNADGTNNNCLELRWIAWRNWKIYERSNCIGNESQLMSSATTQE
jgi:hypothetical protein